MATARGTRARRGLRVALLSFCLGALPGGAPAQEADATLVPRPAWMGIRGAPGVHVHEVVDDGPADLAGLQVGDLITGVDGRSSIDEGGLLAYLGERRPGDLIRLEVLRLGEELELDLTLGVFPLDVWIEREKAIGKMDGKAPRGPRPPAPPLPADAPEAPRADLRWLGAEERPFLGVRLQELTPGLAAYLGLTEARGLLVEHVHEDSPAEAAGMRAGDVLLSVSGEPLTDMTQLGDLLRRRSPGDSVVAEWHREGRVQQATLVLAARKKDIWVVSPPSPTDRSRKEAAALEARLRALEAQQRGLERSRAELERRLEELAGGP
jgi:predicted metalloprotease with PDZ domain